MPVKKTTTTKHDARGIVKSDIEIGKRIRAKRASMSVSQETLGRKLGISFQQIQKYERGANRVGAARLQQIATILEVPVTYFYGEPEQSSEVESLLSMDNATVLRIMRAYTKIKNQNVARQFVILAESIVAEQA